MKGPIYLDYNATTPIDPRVIEVIQDSPVNSWGNPSSAHIYGYEAQKRISNARAQLASLLGCQPDEVVFTSGGSESNNMAIKGMAFHQLAKGRHLITSAIEHPAVLSTCRYLEERFGFSITYLPVNISGLVDPADVEKAIRPDTTLVTIMMANNETGTLQPIAEISEVTRRHGILFHTDAAQAVGKIPTSVTDLNVDLLTVAGHKLYAPKGIGALYVRRGLQLDSLIHGANHESGRRAGTENVPYIAGLGKACELAAEALPNECTRLRNLRNRLYNALQAELGPLPINGHPTLCLPNTLNVSFLQRPGFELLASLSGLAASTGSACHAGINKPSPVLISMGTPEKQALGAVRFSLGRWTTEVEVDQAAELVAAVCK